MRTFDYSAGPAKLLTPEIIRLLTSIHEHKVMCNIRRHENALEGNVTGIARVWRGHPR